MIDKTVIGMGYVTSTLMQRDTRRVRLVYEKGELNLYDVNWTKLDPLDWRDLHVSSKVMCQFKRVYPPNRPQDSPSAGQTNENE